MYIYIIMIIMCCGGYHDNDLIATHVLGPRINSETNTPPPIINVVCKYLRQFLGTSFGVATLPIYCNIQ